MDLVSTVALGIGLLGGALAVYLVAIQGVKAAINKEAKGIALDTVFKQFGLNRQGVKFWNDLTPQGAATLIATLRAVQQSSGAGLAGNFGGAMSKNLAMIQQLAAMAGQQIGQPQAQPQQ